MTDLWILTYVLILVRVSTFLTLLPLFGRGTIPRTVLIGLSLGLTTLWFSNTSELPEELVANPEGFLQWVGIWFLTIREFIIGGMLGLSFGLLIYPIQIAGSYLAQEMGLSIASLSDPSTSNQSNVLSSLLQTIALLFFFATNLHHFIFATLHTSFSRAPIGGGFQFASSQFALEALASVDEVGLTLIAPIGICLFLVLLILLVLSKASPTMNLFSVGISVRIFAGLFFIVLFAPNLLNAITSFFDTGQNWIQAFMENI